MMSAFPELYFNVDNGYLEGLVRGLKAGVLSQSDYVNLVQCETLEDLKLHLQSTDYGNFLANEASPLTVSVIDDKLKEKMVVEFRHMRNHAYEPLASFLDFITYSYMIDNVILLITGTLHQRSIAELVPKCHPLGSFEQMEAVNIAQTPAELYSAILVDTPLAAFFQDCISEQDLDEMNIEIIRNTLYKFEADRRAFIITINSFGTELSKEDRAKLFPHCGKLYPEGLAQLARADDYEQVKTVADYYPEYKLLFEGAGSNPGDKTLEDRFFEHEVKGCSVAHPPSPPYQNTVFLAQGKGAGPGPGGCLRWEPLPSLFSPSMSLSRGYLPWPDASGSPPASALSGEAEQAGLPQPVPLWRLLCLCEAQGAGVPEHCLDR
uniref:ATPase H+ transporting V0 subunit d1 n=1 Tax=Sarcophilus harrisii TaxID=9305 RepID=A0A7N4NMX3_SARHA